jgi:hypothetical protein
MAATEADALEEGKGGYDSSAGFWIDGDAIALADPRPSPILGLFDEKDGDKLVVIAMPLDDATWLQIDAAAKTGQTVDVAMHIDLLGIDSRGGTYVIHGIDARSDLAGDGGPVTHVAGAPTPSREPTRRSTGLGRTSAAHYPSLHAPPRFAHVRRSYVLHRHRPRRAPGAGAHRAQHLPGAEP